MDTTRFTEMGIDGWRAVIGTAGAVVALLASEVDSVRESIAMVVSGTCVAAFVVPAVAPSLYVTSEQGLAALAFLGGLLGLTFTRIVIRHGPAVISVLFKKQLGIDDRENPQE